MNARRGVRLTASEAAERAGVATSTWRAYVARARQERAAGRDRPNLAPEPDGHYDARTPWWYATTVDAWNRHRPGAGARTDLAKTEETSDA